MSIVWLASYPKSGNTWLRAVLTCYLQAAGDSLSINALIGGMATQREMFDELVGLPSSDMTPGEILRLRPLLHELLAAESPHPTFVKVHDACIRTAAGPLFPRTATAGAVYLVRNPLDVAVSYAHHRQWSIDRTVAMMNRPAATGARRFRRIHGHVPEQRLSWSRNVSSWLESGLPLHVLRYEDALADPGRAFGAVVRFAGLAWDPARLARAVDNARFDRLRAQETRAGFQERQPTAPSFFRSGKAGGWRTRLTPQQVRALVEAHAPVMERFGYLREAEAFLAGATDAAATPGGRPSAEMR